MIEIETLDISKFGQSPPNLEILIFHQSNDDEGGVYQNCKFHHPGQGFFAGAWPHKSYSENALFL